MFLLAGCEKITSEEKVKAAMDEVTLTSEVTADFKLPLKGKHDVLIEWKSDNEAITIDGETAKVHRKEEDVTVKLTATFKSGKSSEDKFFNVVVKGTGKPGPDYENMVKEAKDELEIASEVESDFMLPMKGKHYVVIYWESDNEAIAISGYKAIVTRREEDVTVKLTATLTLLDFTETKEFSVVVKAKEEEPQHRDVTVTFNATIPSNTPMDADIYIAGDFKKAGLPLWNPAAELCKATRISLTEVRFELVYEDFVGPITIEYKWTRGSWASVEKGRNNEELANRQVTVDGSKTNVIINDEVKKWADLELPQELTDEEKVNLAHAVLNLDTLTVDADFELPSVGEFNTVITWESNMTNIITIENNIAVVNRPEETTSVKLTATIKLNDTEKKKEFTVTVLGTNQSQDELDVLAAAEALNVSGLNNLTQNKILPHVGINGTAITWTSSKPDSITIQVNETTGVVTAVVYRLEEAVSGIELTATITKNAAVATKKFTASVRASAFTVTVTWHITVPEPLPNAVVITTGSSDNGWDPADLDYGVARKIGERLYEFKKEFSSPNGTNINLQYKWTLQVPGAGFAPWSGEELTLSGVPINNRTLTITRHTTEVIEDAVLRWRIPVSTSQQSTVIGNLDIIELTDERLPKQYRTRKIRIWTPADYDPEDKTKKYPVIYMHDGQNIFDAVTSYAGEWNADETVTALMKVGGFGGAILVGIDNTDDRLAEYTYAYEWLTGPRRGKAYMDFVVDVVKAYVDANYNTKPERENTMLLGSSMGGLITFFGGLNHLDTFGILAAFSTSTQRIANPETNIPAFLETLDQTLLQNTRFFFYVGTNSDGDKSWPDNFRNYLEAASVPSKSIKTYKGEGFSHNEYAWSTHLPIAIEWAFSLEVQKTALTELVSGLTQKEEDYSENSWQLFIQAKSKAEAVIADENATLTDIVQAYSELTSAIDQLVLVEDMNAAALVDALIIVLPTVADFNETHMDIFNQAKTAYNSLTEKQKILVKYYYVLNLIQKKIDESNLEIRYN